MMSLDKYRAPLCLTDGITFELDDAKKVKVTVRMPINANRKFSIGWAKRLPMSADGKIDASPFDVVEAQRKELFENHIVSITGLDMADEATNFWEQYPLAVEEIWKKVQDALPQYEKQLEVEAKKS
jgi:hypothetical protein